MIPPFYSHRPLAALVRDAEDAEKVFLFAVERTANEKHQKRRFSWFGIQSSQPIEHDLFFMIARKAWLFFFSPSQRKEKF
jgi:hypothetical protein